MISNSLPWKICAGHWPADSAHEFNFGFRRNDTAFILVVTHWIDLNPREHI